MESEVGNLKLVKPVALHRFPCLLTATWRHNLHRAVTGRQGLPAELPWVHFPRSPVDPMATCPARAFAQVSGSDLLLLPNEVMA
jgi:hypothetical protein